MLKINYGTPKQQANIESGFVNLLDAETERQKEWKRLRKSLCTKDVRFKPLLPTQIKDLMILPFPNLAEIYEVYTRLGLDKNNILHKDLCSLFSYDKKTENSKKVTYNKLRDEFIAYFTDSKNGLAFHTCHYCDMTYINYFHYNDGRQKKRTQFDLDHALDKGRCPIVALCLYNLVPSCPTCNGPHIKGQRVMDKISLIQRQKLSPSSPSFDFENKVKIWLKPISTKIHTSNFLQHKDDFELDFDTILDPDYKEYIKFFWLKERYDYHICEALRIADLKVKYTNSRIKELAKIICGASRRKKVVTSLLSRAVINQIKSDIFAQDFSNKNHRALGKLRNDILNG